MSNRSFVDVDTLKARLGMNLSNDDGTADDILTEAIVAAQTHLENELDTPFQEGEKQNVFYLDPNANHGITPAGTIRLLLSAGFLKTAVLTSGDVWNSQPTPVPTADYLLNTEQGYVIIDPKYLRKYIKVTFQHGLTAKTCPQWLKDGICAQAPQLFHLPVSIPEGRGVQNTATQLDAMYAAHHRKLPLSLKPIYK